MLNLVAGVSEVAILLADYRQADPFAKLLQASLAGDKFAVDTWKDLLPMVSAVLKLYDGFIFLWFLVVFIAMGFGIVNTTLMAVYERIREFGLLKALGMKPWWVMRQVLTETFFILIIGMMVGNTLGCLTILPLTAHGIDLSQFARGMEFAGMSRTIFPVIVSRDLILANLVVFCLGLAVSLYPAVKAARFTPVEAMTHI
jgi:ABC-type antimicrobial peptide transport system permease subunit